MRARGGGRPRGRAAARPGAGERRARDTCRGARAGGRRAGARGRPCPRAERRGGTYVLNGTKQLITSGKNADLALAFAATDRSQAKRGISCFIVDTKQSGYCVGRIESKMGQQASDTCEIRFEDLLVPEENRLGAEGQGYRIALANLEGGRIGIASQAVGMARAAYEIALSYAQERRSFGKKIIEHQAVAFRLADMATQLEAARQLGMVPAPSVDYIDAPAAAPHATAPDRTTSTLDDTHAEAKKSLGP